MGEAATAPCDCVVVSREARRSRIRVVSQSRKTSRTIRGRRTHRIAERAALHPPMLIIPQRSAVGCQVRSGSVGESSDLSDPSSMSDGSERRVPEQRHGGAFLHRLLENAANNSLERSKSSFILKRILSVLSLRRETFTELGSPNFSESDSSESDLATPSRRGRGDSATLFVAGGIPRASRTAAQAPDDMERGMIVPQTLAYRRTSCPNTALVEGRSFWSGWCS